MDRLRKLLPDSVTHWAQLRASDFLGHWDVPEGKTLKMTVQSVQLEECINPATKKKEWKTTMAFSNQKKHMVLNSTNMKAIASWYGDNPRGWYGKEVELSRAFTNLRGETVECLRIVPNDKKGVQDRSKAAQKAAE